MQHALLTLFDLVPVTTVVQKTAHAPALRFEVRERGFLREGYWADLVLVDPDGRTVVDDEPVFSKCGWTPFAGVTFGSRITHTFLNGRLVYRDGEVVTAEPAMALEFERDGA